LHCGDWLVDLRGIVSERMKAPLRPSSRSPQRPRRGHLPSAGHGDYDFANLLYGDTDEVSASSTSRC
jgi:hypothetical protein